MFLYRKAVMEQREPPDLLTDEQKVELVRIKAALSFLALGTSYHLAPAITWHLLLPGTSYHLSGTCYHLSGTWHLLSPVTSYHLAPGTSYHLAAGEGV